VRTRLGSYTVLALVALAIVVGIAQGCHTAVTATHDAIIYR